MNRLSLSALAAVVALSGLAPTHPAQGTPVRKKPAKKAAKKPKTPLRPSAALKAAPFTVVGRAVNGAGKPLSGVEISIYGTTIAGANTSFSALTGADGRFRQRVPDGIYGVGASLKRLYNNKEYLFQLHPRDGLVGKRHDAAKGIVKEFVWKISGLKPGETPGEEGSHTEGRKYYGGVVHVTAGEEEPFAGSTIEAILTPRGPLIDGSAGQPRVFRKAIAAGERGYFSWHLNNVPIGLYSMRVRLLSPSGERPLGLKAPIPFDAPFAPSINLDFKPTFGVPDMMQVAIEAPSP
jgi:hypothetical protein